MNKKILQLALPSIVSNITVPLLGLVDVAIVGHLGSPAYIGAIAIGSMIFSMIYWIFVFLRMGTSGLTAQAYGRRDLAESAQVFVRSVGVALSIGLVLIAFQSLILRGAFHFVHTTPEIQQLATRYFRICVWGAPAMLGLYGFAGWFVGMQNSRFPMYIAIVQNVVNIVTSLCFVFLLKMNVEGVALGTLIAQYAGCLLAFALWLVYYGRFRSRIRWREVVRCDALLVFFRLNRDIFLRTLCLVAVTTYFTAQGAGRGEIVLAVNTLLMQLFTLFSYVMDGFAYAAEALTGRYVGAGNPHELRRMIRALFGWGLALALLFTLVYCLGGIPFLGLLTDERSVLEAARAYAFWTWLIPLAGMAAFLWDGVFIGATASRHMLYSMFLATVTFFAVYLCLHTRLGNHALWLAFISYLFVRGLVQTCWAPRIFMPNK